MIKDNSRRKRRDMIIYHIMCSIKRYVFHIFFYSLVVKSLLHNSLYLIEKPLSS